LLDGEIICSDGSGRPQFYDLLRGTRAPSYIAFDIVWLNGVDLREARSQKASQTVAYASGTSDSNMIRTVAVSVCFKGRSQSPPGISDATASLCREMAMRPPEEQGAMDGNL
jgi:hypothetical protein